MLLKFGSKPWFVYLFDFHWDWGYQKQNSKHPGPVFENLREAGWLGSWEVRDKIPFEHLRSREVPVSRCPILKSSECNTRPAWQKGAASDILETGLIWWTVKPCSLEICFSKYCPCSSQVKSQVVKMCCCRNETTSEMNSSDSSVLPVTFLEWESSVWYLQPPLPL